MFGSRKLTDMKDDERLLEVPTDEDENVGNVPKKKIRKKKSKEERVADRKVVFWTFLFVLGITIFFWIWPLIKEPKFNFPNFEKTVQGEEKSKPEKKNYIEYKL